MKKDIYEIVTMPNGLKMMSLLPINRTGLARAYCTVRDNPMGHSQGPCGPFSCNTYKKVDLENGIKDFQLCCDALGISVERVVTNRLTAFTDIVRAVDDASLVGYDIYDEPAAPRADGLITATKGLCLYNYAADCAIVLFLDPVKKVIGSLHASWKGSLIGIIENEVEAFVQLYGCDKKDIIAVLLPSISGEYFGVQPDCAQQFIDAGFADSVYQDADGQYHVHLPGVNTTILHRTGLAPHNIHVIDDLCTYRDENLFHSYRRGPVDERGIHLNGQNGYFIHLVP